MSTEIATAIEQRRLLTFTYDGHDRKVIPAALGVAKRKAKPVLHAYQVEGTSSGDIPAWRFFYVDKMVGLRVLDETFAADPPGWAPSSLENVQVSLPFSGKPAGGRSGSGGSGGGTPSMPSIPPEAEKIVKDVMGAVGRWFKKR